VPASTAHRPKSGTSAAGAGAYPIDDTRIADITELAPPSHLLREFPCTERPSATVYDARQAIHRVLHGADDRLLVVVGPCSIHDYDAAIDYATRLATLKHELADRLIVVMRVYFEKPRTTVGWKGLINDPRLDDTFRINEGLRLARRILLEINELDLPAGTEYLDMITPQYIADLIAWGAIGARTTESQVHRQLASGLSCPVGFKNGTNGDVKIAVDAIKAASAPHHFLSVTKGGHSAIVHTSGNEDCHIILRGGKTTNYDAASVDAVCKELANNGLPARVMIDCSHANSQKQHERQVDVARDIARQVASGDARIFGAMIESHINAGRQDLVQGQPLQYGVSITDACIAWDTTAEVLHVLADAVGQRRLKLSDEA
jgi:3-deoxy-7-phosphoheptulonate synthase